jgi:hypothetical protein
MTLRHHATIWSLKLQTDPDDPPAACEGVLLPGAAT